MPFIKKVGREIERGGKRFLGFQKDILEDVFTIPIKGIEEIARIPGNLQRAFLPPFPGASAGATGAGTADGTATPALPEIVQPTPLPGPGEVSVQLGTGQERARRRRARSRRQGRVFGGAGLLVPEADVRRQTLGGF